MRGWSTRYGSGWLAARSERGLSVEGGLAARLGLDLTLTQVPMSLLYEAGSFVVTKRDTVHASSASLPFIISPFFSNHALLHFSTAICFFLFHLA